MSNYYTRHLHIDIETYSPIDLKKSGVYPYAQAENFEVLVVAYCLTDTHGSAGQLESFYPNRDGWPASFLQAFADEHTLLWAHNAAFERVCLAAYGLSAPINRWRCTARLSQYYGLPASLKGVSEAQGLEELKSDTGKTLIRKFSVPRKPTKNNSSTRNLPEDFAEDFAEFVAYCEQDVRVEMAIHDHLVDNYPAPYALFWRCYQDNERINDRGISLDTGCCKLAVVLDQLYRQAQLVRMKKLTGIKQPNSLPQLKKWLSERLGRKINAVTKDTLPELLREAAALEALDVKDALHCRQQLSKTSVTKYAKAADQLGMAGRVRGQIMYYGANRTGRFAGIGIQVHNLPRGSVSDVDTVRALVFGAGRGDEVSVIDLNDELERHHETDLPNALSSLVRSVLVAEPGRKLVVVDYAAVEARILSWLADDQARLDVFRTHGKIYEATASRLFGVPIEKITKDSPERQRGKVAELAFGYAGSVGAYRNFDKKTELTDDQIQDIVDRWRRTNPAIVKFWNELERACLVATSRQGMTINLGGRFQITHYGGYLEVTLPSGRPLYYHGAYVDAGKYGQPALWYCDSSRTGMTLKDTHKGKLTENVTQAIGADLLMYSLRRCEEENLNVVLHVHDEIVLDVREDEAEDQLAALTRIMEETPLWAEGLPLRAAGFMTDYYKK